MKFLRRSPRSAALSEQMVYPLFAMVPHSAAPGVSVLSSDVVARCASGDAAAWRRLYFEHEAAVRRFLLRLGVSRNQLDDACQEVFLQAFRYLPTFRAECSFKTWLYRLCSTQARKARGRARLRHLLLQMLPWEAEATMGQTGDLPARASELVDRALSTLATGEREVFVLYELEGLAGSEIAAITGCPEATVWRRLHYARKKFCAYVEHHPGAM